MTILNTPKTVIIDLYINAKFLLIVEESLLFNAPKVRGVPQN